MSHSTYSLSFVASPAEDAQSALMELKAVYGDTPFEEAEVIVALGGDGFTAFKGGRDPVVGPYDDEALFAYLKANSPLAPPPRDRILNRAQ